MNRLLNWLFGLSSMGFGDEGVHVSFARPIPGWGWALAVLAAAGLALWSYSRLTGSARSRIALASLRGLVLLLILLVISGPQLVRPNDRTEKDWVVVLVDRSASMTIADAPAQPGSPRRNRDQQLADAINGSWPAFAQMAKDRTVLWLGFDSGVYDLGVREEAGELSGLDVGPAAGRRTSLGVALDQALARAAARPVSGVVVLSDGRSIDEAGRGALRRLQAERIPVMTLPLGSPDPVADLAVSKAEAPAMAFINDTVPVSVEIERLGTGARGPGGRVQLVDRATGMILDEQPIPADESAWADGRSTLTLTSKPVEAGRFLWVVRVLPDAPDLIDQNNQAEVGVELVDRPLRVAYFDGYPRWEQRYIKQLLLRELSIESASLLLASNRQYLQEGDIILDALPRSPEDWARFDVIILGDFPGSLLSVDQLEQLREHIAVRGAGLLWVGGPGSTPGAWRDTPLADLLPFSLGNGVRSGDQTVRAWSEPVLMFPSPGAKRLNLLQLSDDPQGGWPARLSDPRTGWAQLHFAQRIEPESVKPTAEVLATIAPAAAADGTGTPPQDATPGVLSMRYGAGRVLYVATDEIWRWRYARGEALFERFWLPLLRLQGRESLARSARPALIEVGPRRPQVDEAARVSITLLDQSLVDASPATLTVRVRPADQPGPTGATTDLTLVPDQGQSGTTRGARSYSTTWIPAEPGKYRLEAVDPLLATAALATDVEITLPDDELRRPESDHPALARLSEQTGGQVLTAAQLSTLPDLLPKRLVQISGTPDIQPLWDRPFILILLVLLLTLEWVGRRLIRLA